jgi:exocyst complex component 3
MDVGFKDIDRFRIGAQQALRHVTTITPLPFTQVVMAAHPGSISAAHAIGEYLQAPDDLAKVSAFRKKLEKEKASIDARLKSGVKEQLQATRLGLKKFLSTRQSVQAIKDEMMTIEKDCEDPSVRVATFDQIGRVCKCLT